MPSRAKSKGDAAEREIAEMLTLLVGQRVRRKLGAGRLDDTGDLDGLTDTTVQVANWADALRAVREKPLGCETQRLNAGTTFAATAVRLRGGVWRIVMTPEQFATWYREATQPSDQPEPQEAA